MIEEYEKEIKLIVKTFAAAVLFAVVARKITED